MITRKAGWHAALVQYLGEISRAPYCPGQNDCALFAAGAVAAMTGVDLAEPFRGQYDTLAGGFAMLQSAGYQDHVALAAASFEEIHPVLAAPGDLAVLPGPAGAALGIVQGEGIYALTEVSLGLVPLDFATRAFRVPA